MAQWAWPKYATNIGCFGPARWKPSSLERDIIVEVSEVI